MATLAALPRAQALDGVRAFGGMQARLSAFLRPFADGGCVVREELVRLAGSSWSATGKVLGPENHATIDAVDAPKVLGQRMNIMRCVWKSLTWHTKVERFCSHVKSAFPGSGSPGHNA
jgi:hypothetical protein